MRIHGGQSNWSNSATWNKQNQTPAPSAGGESGRHGRWGKGGDQGDSYTPSFDVAGQANAGGNGRPHWGGNHRHGSHSWGSNRNNPGPTPGGGDSIPDSTKPTPTPGGSSSSSTGDNSSSGTSSASGGKVTLFGGSQSGENNIDFANNSGEDMYVYAQKGLQPGEKDPGGTVFKIPAGGKVTVNALENNGLRFQKYTDQLSADQKAQLDQNGVVNGITAPAKTGTLYETNYVPDKHLSYDDISPLDGANIPMSMSGNGGRTVHFTQAEIDGAPSHNPDGTVPGLGPDASSTGNAAANPALRDYYAKTSLRADGTRDFYYNSSVGGDADKANVSYTGAGAGKVRTTVSLG